MNLSLGGGSDQLPVSLRLQQKRNEKPENPIASSLGYTSCIAHITMKNPPFWCYLTRWNGGFFHWRSVSLPWHSGWVDPCLSHHIPRELRYSHLKKISQNIFLLFRSDPGIAKFGLEVLRATLDFFRTHNLTTQFYKFGNITRNKILPPKRIVLFDIQILV